MSHYGQKQAIYAAFSKCSFFEQYEATMVSLITIVGPFLLPAYAFFFCLFFLTLYSGVNHCQCEPDPPNGGCLIQISQVTEWKLCSDAIIPFLHILSYLDKAKNFLQRDNTSTVNLHQVHFKSVIQHCLTKRCCELQDGVKYLMINFGCLPLC